MTENAAGDRDRSNPEAVDDPADRIVLSVRVPGNSDDADRIEGELTAPSYQRYLRRAHAGPIAIGEEWSEFVGAGCGTGTGVTLRVEEVRGGTAVGADTSFEIAAAPAAP